MIVDEQYRRERKSLHFHNLRGNQYVWTSHIIRNRFSPWSADDLKVSEIIVKTDSVLYSSEQDLMVNSMK